MKLRIYIYSLFISLFGFACSDIAPLDELEPQNKLVEENAFKDAKKVEHLLSGMYVNWRHISSDLGRLFSLSGNYIQNRGSDYSNNLVQVDNNSNEQDYRNLYECIQAANFIIDNLSSDIEIDGLSETRRLEIEAEARCSRAIAHFRLLQMYGQFYDIDSEYGIVLRLTAARVVEQPSRSTVQQVYSEIVKDFDFAIENAPAVNNHYLLSQTTAKAYKAKVLLYMGEYADASTIAADAITDPNYALAGNIVAVFADRFNGQEVMFAPYSSFWSEFMNGTMPYAYGWNKIPLIAADEAETGEQYDRRFSAIHPYGSPFYNLKYPQEFYQEGTPANTAILLRMAEVYLIEAEAQARLATSITDEYATKAITRMNEIRTRGGMPGKDPTTLDELLEAIRIEKNLELFGEAGQPWFDMVRFYHDDLAKITAIKPAITKTDQLILPLPRAAFTANPNLDQNPGYIK